MPKKKKSTKRKAPIGFVKQGKSFKLVFGTKTKPRLSTKRFSSKKSLLTYARNKFGKKKR